MTLAELDSLAHSLAYESACSAIECGTLNGNDAMGDWLILDSDPDHPSEDSYTSDLRKDIQYLAERGLLIRHPSKPTWIQLQDESEATA